VEEKFLVVFFSHSSHGVKARSFFLLSYSIISLSLFTSSLFLSFLDTVFSRVIRFFAKTGFCQDRFLPKIGHTTLADDHSAALL